MDFRQTRRVDELTEQLNAFLGAPVYPNKGLDEVHRRQLNRRELRQYAPTS